MDFPNPDNIKMINFINCVTIRLDGIRDDEIPPDSDWQWLTPMERIGIQTQFDADCAKQAIDERKRKFSSLDEWKDES